MKKIALLLASTIVGLSQANAADGAAVYATCSACHQPTGAGIPGAFPPLAGSEWVNGPAENLIRIQLRGLMGPIEVKGKTYNSVMPPNATLSDEDIAAVLTYVRSNFGNKAPAITAEQVKALRSEAGKPMLKAEELIDPAAAPKEEAKPAAPKKTTSLKAGEVTETGVVTKSEVKAGPNKLVLGGIAVWSLVCLLPVITGFGRKA